MGGLRSGHEVHGVIQEQVQHGQAIRYAARRPGEVDDEGFTARAGQPAGEPGPRELGRREIGRAHV